MASIIIAALAKFCVEVGTDLSDKCRSPETPQSPSPSSSSSLSKRASNNPAPHFLYAAAPPPKTITIHKTTFGPKETVRLQLTPEWAEVDSDLHIALPHEDSHCPSSSPTGSLPFLCPVSPLLSGL
ncbi:hypothetical protein RQP46_005597 [Phenoliferia psychrophenolica]